MNPGDKVTVVNPGTGYEVYKGREGRVSRVMTVLGREKVIIDFPPAISEYHGGLWTPWPLEIFADHVEENVTLEV